MNPKQNPELMLLRMQAERTIGHELDWTYSEFFGGSAFADTDDGEVSVMLQPPEGQPQVKMPVPSDNGGELAHDDFVQPDAPDDFNQEDALPSFDGSGNIQIDPLGATFTGDVSWKEWHGTVKGMLRLGRSLPWIVGDLLNYGEARWGEQWSQVLTVAETLKLSPNTISQYKSVASRVPRAERVEDVSWSCWRMLAARTPDERQAGMEAYADGRTTDEVKRLLDGTPEPEEIDLPPCPACGAEAVLKTKCPSCGKTFLDLAWWALELKGEIGAFVQTGEIGATLKKILEADSE